MDFTSVANIASSLLIIFGVFAQVIDAMFIIDVFLNSYCIGFRQNGVDVYDRKEIFQKYWSSDFIVVCVRCHVWI